MLAMGIMNDMLSDDEETVNAIKKSIGRIINKVVIDEDQLVFYFADGSKLIIWDDGQSCCEIRYMNTDDDLEYYKKSKLLDFELSLNDNVENIDYWEVEDSQFLKVKTSLGVFTVANYNAHNGYYGGFAIKAYLEEK